MPPATAKDLFLAALRLPPGDWPAFLRDRCGGDDRLRARVADLLRAHREAASRADDRPGDPDETAGYSAGRDTAGPGTVIGPYALREPLGEGGMGLVFVAEQTAPVRRKVALKVVKPGMDTRQVVARFEAERQALALMDHPNIATVLDGGATPDGRPFFVMELVKGAPITDHCDAQRLTVRDRLRLFLQVCGAVQHAHQKGVIHRDLKPSNILVAVHDVEPVAKVIDFGIAKAVGQQLTDKTVYTAVAQFIGTPVYMSPEQAGQSSLDVDTRTDVYALGVLLYELLTGTTPFEADRLRAAGLDEFRRIVREEEPARPSARLSTLAAAARSTVAEQRRTDLQKLTRQVTGELDWVVMKCLEKDRNRRYESVSALAADVRRHLADEPIEARRPSLAYRVRKFVRRNRGRVAVIGAVVGLAVLAAAAAGWVYLERAAERDRAAGGVRESLAGARAAIEAGDLTLAGQRVAEARGRLGPDPGRLGDLAAGVDRVGQEVDARRADADRFRQFLALAEEGQDKMGYGGNRERAYPAEEALGLYGVLSDDGWLGRLDGMHLTGAQKGQVREAAYVTLVSLADYHVRWKEHRDDPQSVRRSLDLLARAASFHEPTRAYYFVRSRCHRLSKDAAAAEEDVRRYKAMAGRTAWDYYLPGHTAGWDGDLAEAIRSYEAALRIQPDHYNSLFFLADRLSRDKINRRPEAVQLFAACIALRPTHVWAYFNRAECFEKLGRRDEAEADLTAAVERATTDEDRGSAHGHRAEFYMRSGPPGKHREDRAKQAVCYERWVQERTNRLGPDHPDTLTAMRHLAAAYREIGRTADVVRITERVAERQRAVLGPDHPDTLLTVNDLAVAYSDAGRREDHLRLLEPAVEQARTNLGPDHATTLLATHNLGVAYCAAGRRTDGVRLLEQVAERSRASLGPDHTTTLDAMTSLAVEYHKADRFADELRVLEPLVERSRAVRGPDHPDTLLATNSLAVAYEEVGRPDDAIRVFEPLLEKVKVVHGADHPNGLYVMENLANAYHSAGRFADTTRVLEPLVEKSRGVRGPDHPETLRRLVHLAVTYTEVGRFDLAEPLARDAIGRLKRVAGPRSRETADALAVLGMNLLKQGRYAEAEPVLRECLPIREEVLPDDWRRFNTMSQLGGALLGQKRYAEAEPLLLKGYEGMRARAATIPPAGSRRLREAVERIVGLYEATGRPDDAKEWRAKIPREVAPPPRPVGPAAGMR